MSRSATTAAAPAAMSSPAQLERLAEHLRKLRLVKSGERLEALLQEAAARELPYAEFLEQVLGEEVAAKASKNIAMRTAMATWIVSYARVRGHSRFGASQTANLNWCSIAAATSSGSLRSFRLGDIMPTA